MFKSKLFLVILQIDTLVLILGFVILWFSISLFVDSNFTISDLKPHTGKLTGIDSSIIRVKDKLLFKEIKKELYLSLDNESKKFTHITTEHFGDIVSNIKIGDSITLYSKPKLWGIFGLKKKSAVNHLVKGSTIIIDYKNFKQTISGFAYPGFVLFLIILVMYVNRIRHKIYWKLLD